MRRKCPSCGTRFSAQRATAVYCSATCRQRAARDRKAAGQSVHADTEKGRAEHPLVTSVRTRLEAAAAVSTVDGQVALQLARRLANPDESAPSALARELRSVLALALTGSSGPAETVDLPAVEEPDDLPDEVRQARQRRDAARQAAGQA